MNHPRRGFAAIMAVALLALVAVTAIALFAAASTDYHRTQYAQQSAQLRQMLLAGAAQVMQESKDWTAQAKEAKHPIQLPDELSRQGASATFTVIARNDGKCEVNLVATLGVHHAGQVLTLERQNEKWKIISAQLEG